MGRVIFHLDMDAYFASIEQQVDPKLRGRPIGVTGRPTERSIVVAFSREAKRFDVRTGMPAWEARRVCRSILFVPGRPERYVETTKRFLAILKCYTPKIEVFSTDEVFMDMTREVDRYGGTMALAKQIKARFREELGPCITSTIGIAGNKTFAKLIAKRHKPDGIGYLREDDLPELLHITPVAKICGIGPRIERRLGRMGIRTLADLGELPTSLLRREFGVYGIFLKGVGIGIDPSPVIPYSDIPAPKSVGHSRSLPPQLRTFSLALHVLRDLCDKVGRRMRKLGYVGRTVHCGFRLGPTGPYHGKQTTLATPTDDDERIYRACLDILQQIPI
ncbi:MAG: DNA polymerase IV, partial [Candidatus Bipolaricaulia bacterium]